MSKPTSTMSKRTTPETISTMCTKDQTAICAVKPAAKPNDKEKNINLKNNHLSNKENPKRQDDFDHPFMMYLDSYPALAASTYQLLSWDTSLCIYINRYSNYQRIASLFKGVSRLGDGWFWGIMLLAAVVETWLSAGSQASTSQVAGSQVSTAGLLSWLPLVTVLITSSLGIGLYKILKVKTVRPRPYQVHQVIIMGERPLDVFSFPSGHTLQAVLFTCALGSYFPALLWVMIPFAVLVALSRMILGLHYPTDVLVGAGLGFALAQLSPLIHECLVLGYAMMAG